MNVLAFELFVISYVAALWVFMKTKGYKRVTAKFVILFLGVLFFEIISEPMWLNTGFHRWAYIYRDITWVLTLGWVGIFMTSIVLVDYVYRQLPDAKRFFLYLLAAEAITVPIETSLIQAGIRNYAPVLLDKLSGILIPYTHVPIEALAAFPLFSSLIISFYKYINFALDKK